MITQERLHELFDYDASTGNFIRKTNVTYNAKIGDVAGCKDHSTGYLRLRIDGKAYYCHRLAWFYVHGSLPAMQIDHINGNRTDNRIENLREASNYENCLNNSLRTNNTSGYIGVSWSKNMKKWESYITSNQKRIKLGYFDDPEKAHQAYVEAKQKLHHFQQKLRPNAA